MPNHYDVTIIGAGPVGISLALALATLPLRIALLEAKPLTTEIKADQDSRALALTAGSVSILEEIGVWPQLAAHATPIKKVHISDRGHFGFTRIKAEEEGVAALGYVVPAYTLANELNKALLTRAVSAAQISPTHLALLVPATVQNLQASEKGWQIEVATTEGTKTIYSQLVIAADGTHSTIRSLLKIATTEKDYAQSALVTTITLAREHHNTAYERFVENGALAMLPMGNGQCGCVWTGPHAQIKSLLHLADEELLQHLQINFGYRLGKFLSVGKRYTYPLKMVYANEPTPSGLVLIGNAAHTLHPIAAQGFNLGLGDVAALAQVLRETLHTGKNLHDPLLLDDYHQAREKKVAWIMRFTDGLTQFFAHDFLPLTMVRNGSLLAVDLFSPLKRRLAKRLMGK